LERNHLEWSAECQVTNKICQMLGEGTISHVQQIHKELFHNVKIDDKTEQDTNSMKVS